MTNAGKILTTKPMSVEAIAKIKKLLQYQPRNRAWFYLSLNSAFRGGETLSITMDDITFVGEEMEIHIRCSKTGKLRKVLINAPTTQVVKEWLAVHPQTSNYLFCGLRGKMHTPYFSQLLKRWMTSVGEDASNIATHSCRKSWVRISHDVHKVPLWVLSTALSHNSEQQTRVYMGLLAEGVAEAYSNVI